jgi:hypothetical protein
MAGTNRLESLAQLAATLTPLPVDKQFEILANHGLRLEDINWKNQQHSGMGLETRIPTKEDVKSVPVKA